MLWDVFISHASEDKAEVARPLAEALRVRSKGSGLNGTALYPAWGYVEELIVAMVRLRSFVDGRA